MGDNAAPVASDPKYSGEFLIGSYRPQIMTGGAVMFTCELEAGDRRCARMGRGLGGLA